MAREKIDGYAKEWQMYRCDETEKEICKNCAHWGLDPGIPSMWQLKTCLLDMDSIGPYMSCDKFKQATTI